MIYAVILRTLTRTVYALLGVGYLLVGVGSIALPAGWISPRWVGDDVAGLYAAATPESFLNHLTQEFGTLVIAGSCQFNPATVTADPGFSVMARTAPAGRGVIGPHKSLALRYPSEQSVRTELRSANVCPEAEQ